MRLSTLLTGTAIATSASAQTSPGGGPTNYLGSYPSQRLTINQTQAQTVIAAAVERANELQTTLNIAVVDTAAHLVAFLRMDNAYLGSIDLSQKKARLVTLFNGQAPSGAFYNLTQPGGELWSLQETNGGLVPLGGGQPIIDEKGHLIGAVGVSGGAVGSDVQVAVYAAKSVGSTIEI